MLTLLYQDGGCPVRSTSECAGSAAVTRPGGPHGRGRREKERKKVPVMTDVACFCGCCFSFDGGAAACPRCGQVASVTADLALEDAGRSQPTIPGPVVNGIGHNGHTPQACPEPAEAGASSGRPAGAVHDRGEPAGRRPLPAHSRN
jgi:hypothetical protein